jgi:hypothetical protein
MNHEEFETEETPQASKPEESQISQAVIATAASFKLQEKAAIEEFIGIKNALSTPNPPWVLAKDLNPKIQELHPPPNTCIGPPSGS